MSTDIAPTSPGRPRDEDATAAILTATLRLLAAQGYDGTSTADVAAAARASKATVYRRWPSKVALVAEAIQQGLREAHEAPVLTGDVRADLAEALAAKMRALSDGPLGGAIRAVISHAAHEPELSAATALILAGARMTPRSNRASGASAWAISARARTDALDGGARKAHTRATTATSRATRRNGI